MQRLPKRAIFSRFPVTIGMGGFGMFIFVVSILLLSLIGGTVGGTERIQRNVYLVINSLGIIFTGSVLVYSYLRIILFRYCIDEDEVIVEQGVLAKSYDSILYSRIQNVNIERSWIERILGLSTVNIQTAGSTTGAEAAIPGIRKTRAEQVRERIFDKIHATSENQHA